MLTFWFGFLRWHKRCSDWDICSRVIGGGQNLSCRPPSPKSAFTFYLSLSSSLSVFGVCSYFVERTSSAIAIVRSFLVVVSTAKTTVLVRKKSADACHAGGGVILVVEELAVQFKRWTGQAGFVGSTESRRNLLRNCTNSVRMVGWWHTVCNFHLGSTSILLSPQSAETSMMDST